jgi:hypothetical protein
MKYDSEFIPALEFWPEDVVKAAFDAADAALGTEGEALALRVFYTRMKHHFKTSDLIDAAPDDDNRMTEEYERPRLEAEIALMEGRMPVPCEGCPFVAGCKNGAARRT